MLRRETEMVQTMVGNAWQQVTSAHQTSHADATRAIAKTFEADPRTIAAIDALTDFGLVDPVALLQGLTANTINSYSFRPAFTKTGLYADYQAAIAALPAPTYKSLGAIPAYGELSIALSTCKKKWPDIQTDIYSLVSDLTAPESYEDIEVAIRRFTIAIA